MNSGARRPIQTAAVAALVVGLLSGSSFAADPANPPPVASSVAMPPSPSRESLPMVRKRASDAKQMLVIEFSAEWCSPCKQFERDVLPRESVRTALARVQFVRFDAETDVGKEAARTLLVEGYPTFVAIRTDGEVASALQGAQSEPEFVRWLHLMASDFEPNARLIERLRVNPTDGEAMLLWALRLRKRGDLTGAAEWLEKARVAPGASSEVTANADWELRRLRLKFLIPRQQLIEHLSQHLSGPHADEAVRALLRLGPPDAASQAVLARYLDSVLTTQAAERVNQLVYRLLRARAFSEAERAARYLLSLDAKSAYYLDTLAEVQHLRGDAKEAVRLSTQALSLVPSRGAESLRQGLLSNQARFSRGRRELSSELAAPDDDLQPWERD